MSVNNRDISTSILSLKEIVGIIIVFSFVLYLLFPKNNIDQIIEDKGKNTNLSINYLESMLLYYPDNIKLKMLLMRNYHYAQKTEKERLLIDELLVEVKDKTLLKQLYKMQYILMKNLYFEKGDVELLEEVKEKLNNYFEFTKGERDYTFFFAESTQIDFTALKYVSLRGFLKERPELINYAFEKDAFLQAFSLGFKKDAHEYLLNLLNYKEVEKDIQIYALSLLLENQDYARAEEIATQLFIDAKRHDVQLKYFNTALSTIIQQSKDDYKEKIGNLIHLYQENISLGRFDILFLLKSLLQIGDVKGASLFALKSFHEHRDAFDENVTKISIKSLVYDQQLPSALKLSLFAKEKFNTIEWLDKTIQLSLWNGKMREVMALNIEGYRKYKNLKYEHYILNNSTLNSAYEVLGEIYTNKLEKGDLSTIEKLSKYYDYTGEIPKAEAYFTKLLKKVKDRRVHKEAILFSYKNSHYKKGLKLYERFQQKYKFDKTLHEISVQKLIALKEYKKAYAYTKQLKEDKRLSDLGWLEKDYLYMEKMLWKAEKSKKLAIGNYHKLINLEGALHGGERVPYLYHELWKKTRNRSYLTALFYLYLEKKDLDSIKKLLLTLNNKDRAYFEQNKQYLISIANYHIENKKIPLAMKFFSKALALNMNDASTHQAYLWFLLDNELVKPLKKELSYLRRKRKLQKKVGFPSVVMALKFQKSDLALRWLMPLLKRSDSIIEYQVVYADLLELQDRVEGAKRVRLQLFRNLNRKIKENPQLLKDKAFARVYLGLTLRYKTPYDRRGVYFESFKSLFSKNEFIEMKLGQYTYSGNSTMVKYLADRHQMSIPWLNLYLAMSFEDNLKKQQLLEHHKDILPFRDRVMASLDIGDRAGAFSLAFQGLEDNSQDSELFRIYNDMINSDYPKGEFSTHYKHLTPRISAVEKRMGYRWSLYKGIDIQLLWKSYNYKRENTKDISDNSFSFSLRNNHKKFLWDFSFSKHNTHHNFTSASLDLKYISSDFELLLKSKYQEKSTQTPKLQVDGMESGVELNLRKVLSQRIQMGLNYKKSSYKRQNRENIGSSEHLQLSADYLLRAGYPDMRFNTYISQNHYDEVIPTLLPNDFIEIGTQFTIGNASKETIHRSWRPFASIGMALNDHYNLGTTLSLGVSGSIKGEDTLSLKFDYSKGIDAIAQPYYGIGLNYQF